MAPVAVPVEDRLRSKLRLGPGGCWLFTGSTNKRDGYGQFSIKRPDGRWISARAHRVAYSLWVEKIPEEHEVHHDCEQPLCCNPHHLFVRTRDEHATEHRREFCKEGHPLSGKNLYVSPQGRRGCAECRRAAVRRYYHRQRQKES